jgi:histidinol dehydrogenase
MNVSPTDNHRSREKGIIVYPVYSRRSKGLSLGVNLFPARKTCSFNCPYCEIFPFKTDFSFDLELMETALIENIEAAPAGTVKDVCFSGNGEPTLSSYFKIAVNRACAVRQEHAQSAQIVVITNGTGLLRQDVFDFLIEKTHEAWFNLWLKVDAGTEEWFKIIDRPSPSVCFSTLSFKMQEFARKAHRNAITIQTMLCSVDGAVPDEQEVRVWEGTVIDLAKTGSVRNIHLYGKARPSPEDPLTQALPLSFLEERKASLRAAFKHAKLNTPIETFS